MTNTMTVELAQQEFARRTDVLTSHRSGRTVPAWRDTAGRTLERWGRRLRSQVAVGGRLLAS